MILGDCQTDFGIDFKSAVFIGEDYVRGLEGILEREQNLTMVKSFVKVSILRASKSEVPGVDI